MNITVFGCGYVGLVTGACLANLGNSVLCVDIDEKRIAALQSGFVPIYEPGLQEMIATNIVQKRLSFTLDAVHAIRTAEVLFIAVGTPQGENGKADLSAVFQVAETIGKYMNSYKVIVDKSTVPVGTADGVKKRIQEHQTSPYSFSLVSNPEFLREGEAIKDFMTPDRIVLGVEDIRAKEIMTHIYKGIERTGKPIFITDIKSAELIKYASNAFLATKISFMNELAQLCEHVDGDIKEIAKGLGLDSRIGSRFLQAGIGYGGSCFPKDVLALIQTGQEQGVEFPILRAVHEVNTAQKHALFPKIQHFLGNVSGKTIAVLGLSFKPKTDDIREAPAQVLLQQLLAAQAIVRVFDPVAMENMKRLYPASSFFHYCSDAYDAVHDADCLVLVTEWDEFRSLDLEKVKQSMRHARIVDGRNIFDPQEVLALGFQYAGIGRGRFPLETS